MRCHRETLLVTSHDTQGYGERIKPPTHRGKNDNDSRMIMMIIAPNSLVPQKEGAQGEQEEGRGGRSEKVKTDRNSNARRGRSHRSNSVSSVGCEEQEKT